MPVFHYKERGVELSNFESFKNGKVKDYCDRELKFINFNEKHRILTFVNHTFAKVILKSVLELDDQRSYSTIQ